MAHDLLEHYRPNVGVVLFNGEGLVWMGRRNASIVLAGQEGDGALQFSWQFPQGGVDAGEELEMAALRELQEETGVTSVSLLARTQDWTPYDFPPELQKRGKWLGQKQIWYAFRFLGEESEIDLDVQSPPEFEAWRWARLEAAPDLIVPFKRSACQQVVDAFKAFAKP